RGDRGVLHREPLRALAGEGDVWKQMRRRGTAGVARVRHDCESVHGRAALLLEALEQSERGQVRRAGRMDQLAGEPWGAVETGLDQQPLPAELSQRGCGGDARNSCPGDQDTHWTLGHRVSILLQLAWDPTPWACDRGVSSCYRSGVGRRLVGLFA